MTNSEKSEGCGYFLGACLTACIVFWPLAWLAHNIDGNAWWAIPAWVTLIGGGALVTFILWAIIGGLLEERLYK